MRTTIIAADGTQYISRDRARRVRTRLMVGLGMVIILPFILASLIGVTWALIEGPPQGTSCSTSH